MGATGSTRLRALEPEAYQALVEVMRVGVYLIQDGRLVYANPRLGELFAMSREEMLALPSVLEIIAPADRTLVRDRLEQRLSGAIEVLEYTVRGLRKDGEIVDLDVRSSRTMHDGRPAVMGTMVDITDQRRLEQALRSLSVRDDLTGLYNRRGFLTLAEAHLSLARRKKRSLLLIFADVDDLKAINDEHGHAAGDRALVAAARALRNTYRSADLIARIGGDEFTVFPLEALKDSAALLVSRLRQHVDAFNEGSAEPFRLSMSVGVGRYDAEDMATIQDLLDVADRRLYETKRQRKLEPGIGDAPPGSG